MHYNSRPYALCPSSLFQPRPKLIASPWALRCPKPGMVAPLGEYHWEVGGTNDSTIVCLNMPPPNKHPTHPPTRYALL
ncbi:hypothetical protein CVT26_008631 [Gymnopilus dilepis]|uniref:Uncharacterized protein n=1 Tax=Gymnopilus dilepis TaxID=231916 RepID=A0A409XXV3_9AGAR|nr:hypothetical protein CVT26_008631 [Gymnopilus dilepis]